MRGTRTGWYSNGFDSELLVTLQSVCDELEDKALFVTPEEVLLEITDPEEREIVGRDRDQARWIAKSIALRQVRRVRDGNGRDHYYRK